jgi:hypothetical protein
MHCKHAVTKTTKQWWKHMYIDQCNRTENLDVNPCIYSHLIFDEDAKNMQGIKEKHRKPINNGQMWLHKNQKLLIEKWKGRDNLKNKWYIARTFVNATMHSQYNNNKKFWTISNYLSNKELISRIYKAHKQLNMKGRISWSKMGK